MRLYGPLSALAETILRVVAGGVLATHGWGKIGDPFAMSEMVEGLGFYPGGLWSLLLAITEFVGGVCIAIGLLTRLWALAALFVLLVTAYFHWIVQAQGFKGAEYSIVWGSIMLFFAIRGANRHSVDALIGRQL
jgi:putative oxidoreductase